MPRPRRFRRVLKEPRVQRFTPEKDYEEYSGSLKITLDEFEALRLKDYHKIPQKTAAEIMDISQPTFHRTLTLARKKVSWALVEGKIIQIKGGDYMASKKGYHCKKCGFEWQSASKEYDKCPDCDSEDIEMINVEEFQATSGQQGLGRRRGLGRGMGAGPPRVCKCSECGYESPKTPGVPCRQTKCPKCGIPLCGSD